VALGTDSLASNDSLSMLDEMREVAAKYPKTPPREVLRMATEHGAKALHLSDRTGRIEAGLQADVSVVALSGSSKEAFEGVLDRAAKVVHTMVAGRALYERMGEA
jgi:cytosine/adenosine deaminase-related metal-dependent hydrolase